MHPKYVWYVIGQRMREPTQVGITGLNSSGTGRSTSVTGGQGIITRSVKACNSIFHIMAGDFYYEDMPAEARTK